MRTKTSLFIHPIACFLTNVFPGCYCGNKYVIFFLWKSNLGPFPYGEVSIADRFLVLCHGSVWMRWVLVFALLPSVAGRGEVKAAVLWFSSWGWECTFSELTHTHKYTRVHTCTHMHTYVQFKISFSVLSHQGWDDLCAAHEWHSQSHLQLVASHPHLSGTRDH